MDHINIVYFFSFFISLAINNVFCYPGRPAEIVNGDDPHPNEIGYQIALKTFGDHYCGGGIIDEKFVVTAAHCVIKNNNVFNKDRMQVIAGIKHLEYHADTRVEINVTKVYVPIDYDATIVPPSQDIAVLKLAKKIDFQKMSGITKLELPKAENKLTDYNAFIGAPATVTGFGWDEIEFDAIENIPRENGSSSGRLLQARMVVLNNSECQSILSNQLVITDNQICAKIFNRRTDKPQGVCYDDSGDPLVHNKILIGLVSFSRAGCDDRHYPAIFTRISAYVNFIHDALKDRTQNMRTFTYVDETPSNTYDYIPYFSEIMGNSK